MERFDSRLVAAATLTGAFVALASACGSVVGCAGGPGEQARLGDRPADGSTAAATSGASNTGTASTAGAVDSGAGAAPPVDASLGRFVKVACMSQLEDPPEDDARAWMIDLEAVDDGSVWAVGTQGVRLRVHGTTVTEHRVKPRSQRCAHGGASTRCPAQPAFSAITARGPGDVLTAGWLGCGLDPNCRWWRDAERYDGTRWTAMPLGNMLRQSKAMPSRLVSVAGGSVFALASSSKGDSFPGEDVIMRHRNNRWHLLRRGITREALAPFEKHMQSAGRAKLEIDERLSYEAYSGLDVTAGDAVWIVGSVVNVGKMLRPSGPAKDAWQKRVWRWVDDRWSHFDVDGAAGGDRGVDVDDRWSHFDAFGAASSGRVLAVNADEAWAIGKKGVWHIAKGGVKRLPDPKWHLGPTTAAWLGSKDEIWLATAGGRVMVRNGQDIRLVDLAESVGGPLVDLDGAGGSVWALDRSCVWRLEGAAAN